MVHCPTPTVGWLAARVVDKIPHVLAPVWSGPALAVVGCGLTNTVAVIAVPGQLLAVGVIVKVTVIGAVVLFVSVPVILPVPLRPMPLIPVIVGLDQLYVVPVVLLLITIGVIVAPEHIVWLDGVAVTSGVGFTNTVAVIGVPEQPFAVGVIVKVTVIGAAVVLVSVPVILLPDPLPAMPVTSAVLSLTHV